MCVHIKESDPDRPGLCIHGIYTTHMFVPCHRHPSSPHQERPFHLILDIIYLKKE